MRNVGRPDVAELVQEAMAEGNALKTSGLDRDTLFARLSTLVERSASNGASGVQDTYRDFTDFATTGSPSQTQPLSLR